MVDTTDLKSVDHYDRASSSLAGGTNNNKLTIKTNNMENKELNLCDILKGHEGETFYSPCWGHLELTKIGSYILYFDDTFKTDSQGRINDRGECIIFPSKDQRDWSKWDKENNHKVPKTWNELVDADKNEACGITINVFGFAVAETLVEKSALALIKIHQLIEVGYGGNVLCNKENHWDGGIFGYTISIRPSSKTYLDGYEIIPIERRNDVVSPIMFKTKEYAEEFIKHEENCSLLRIFSMVAYKRDIE